MSYLPPPPTQPTRRPAGSDFVPVTMAVEMAEDMDDDPSQDGVGFESTTVVYESGSHRGGQPTGSSGVNGDMLMMNAEAGASHAAASPYAFYEPLHAQQQHGVLGGGGGVEGGACVLPSPVSPPPPFAAGPALLHGTASSVPVAPPSFSDATATAAGILGAAATASMPPTGVIGHDPEGFAAQQPAAAYRSMAYVEDGLEVPLHAPRLRVPTDLPLEQTTLMDLLATMVVQGGPTTEEEIAKREFGRHNPAFAFLGEKFNHPCLLYYRWRLYSLLQQDTLLSWRTTPFQVEQARRAYVFVPPPQLHVGPECLKGLHQPDLFAAESGTGGSGLRSGSGGGGGAHKRAREDGTEKDGGSDGEADRIVTRKSRRHRHRRRHRRTPDAPPPDSSTSAPQEGGGDAQQQQQLEKRVDSSQDSRKSRRRSRGASHSRSSSSSSDSSSSSSSSSDDDEENTGASTSQRDASASVSQNTEALTPPAADEQEPLAASSGAIRAEAVLSVHLPPPSAQWISRQCVTHRHIFTVLQPHLVEEWKQLLNPHAIVSPAACHDMGELCARWLDREAVAARMSFAVQHADGIHHLLSLLLDAVVKVAYVATARSRSPLPSTADPSSAASTPLEQDSGVYCAETLWYLFVLHDIVMNASNMNSGGGAGGSAAAGTTTAASSCVNKATPSAHGRHNSSSAGGSGEAADDELLPFREGSAEALEALYMAFKHQQQQQQQQRLSPSPASSASSSAGGTTGTSFLSSPPSPATAPPLPPQLHRPPPPARRRQRTARRRSPYERCGDALELILPTLMEACTAVALAVSLDKERQPRREEGDAKPGARVHHFKVLRQQLPQQPRQPTKAAESDAVAAQQQALAGSCPPLSLRLDAGCTAEAGAAASTMSAATTPDSGATAAKAEMAALEEKQSSTDSCNAAAAAPPAAAAATSSAPAVLLLEWLRSLVVVWMTAEQPLLLPLPSTATASSLNSGSAAADAGAPVPSELTWPDAQPGMSDTQDVKLAYYVKAPHAHVLGLESGPSPHFSAQQSYEEPYQRQQPPLLSARACAILKERYGFLL